MKKRIIKETHHAPAFLKKGDKVGIVSPARKIEPVEIENAINAFTQWGLQAVTGKHLFGRDNQFSGTDEERATDMQAMLDDKEIKAIVCARGGYGTVRIIDQLNFDKFVQHPKWIVGYSDITVLHVHIHAQFGIETLHATMPINFPADTENSEACQLLRKTLFGESLNYNLPAESLNIAGETSGKVVGGNLSILYSLLASASDIDTQGKILFIEDIDEYLYHIDRMMMALKRAGKLSGIKGLIVGGFTGMNDNTVPFGKTAEEIINSHVKELEIPVCFNFPAGHIPRNLPLIMGREARLSVSANETCINFFAAEPISLT